MLKRISLIAVLALVMVVAACKNEKATAEITFQEEEHDFGTIQQGDKVTYVFPFKNTGEADLVITDARASCGCTVPEKPEGPIKPGASGKITVSFNSAGKHGEVTKTITVACNIKEGSKILKIKANIETPEKAK